MLSVERQERILAALTANRSAKVSDLVLLTGASESTVRRDLAALASAGRLRKVPGGASLPNAEMLLHEPDMNEKLLLHQPEKEAVGRYAASLLEENDVVFLDAGTTTQKMLPYISCRSATYVTNAYGHAHTLARRGFRVYLTGGEVKTPTEALVGMGCLETVERFNFTKCFLGANGIEETAGFTTHYMDEASVKKRVAEKTLHPYVLADHSKFGKIAAVTFAPLHMARVITDRLPDAALRTDAVIEEVGV